ncbi:GIN domain-containing protein [Pedobacter punctiformis]|uniref:DUF2807 domain-containing protein n=1 Tax=Pedobacter punctiformis TaxID=3004097 RepID=A0ABT4L828_9SPHI|nr:DUF2807 domain-containing protein [Pedobacter sp. HCMS5-2]MCZ4243318.1 DUF2807 domain-containing protein [Pedobacter sp. HCMS5-2]
MKNFIKTLFAAALTTVVLSSATIAANASEINAGYTALTQVKNITKIAVSGNVKLILVQDNKEGVEIYGQYYSNNALVQQQGTELRISSFTKDALTIIAHVNNLSSIEASNTSKVITSGSFNLLNLKIALKDQATADINANTINLTTTVQDAASLKLEGFTENHEAAMGSEAKMKMDDFYAQNINISVVTKPVLASDNRYADLQPDLLEKLF